ncbi:DinB family protein [Rhodococcus sp. NPDC060090]|uniref:DinB family protein n=1 Tax=Rhodococcus sp. NPDC060090 TaxID=3347056 RepID=UPI00364B07A9
MTTPRRRSQRRDTSPPKTGNTEAEVLRGFLDYLRNSIATKVETTPEPDVRTAQVLSGTNLLGLLNHLTYVEESIFLGHRTTNWPATFQCAATDTREDVVARYRSVAEQANAVLDSCDDLSGPVPHAGNERPGPNARWALTHMIEETGRHAGHADILRELIDGTTGR